MIKNPSADAGDTRDVSSIPGSGRSPEVGNGNLTPVFLPTKFHGQRSLTASDSWTIPFTLQEKGHLVRTFKLQHKDSIGKLVSWHLG